jgi:hypothetical protein
MARNITMEETGFLVGKRYLLHDRDFAKNVHGLPPPPDCCLPRA